MRSLSCNENPNVNNSCLISEVDFSLEEGLRYDFHICCSFFIIIILKIMNYLQKPDTFGLILDPCSKLFTFTCWSVILNPVIFPR